MSGRFGSKIGGVLSADVAVPEPERALRFFRLAPTTGARALWRDDLMNSHRLPVIGLGARAEAYAGLPLQWMPHIRVADVAASVANAGAAGAFGPARRVSRPRLGRAPAIARMPVGLQPGLRTAQFLGLRSPSPAPACSAAGRSGG